MALEVDGQCYLFEPGRAPSANVVKSLSSRFPLLDGDDEPGGSNDLSHSSVGGASSTSSAQASEKTGDKGDDDDNDGNGDDKHKGGKGAHRRHLALAVPMKHIRRNDSNDEENPFFTEKEDSDDAGFVDQPVSMSIDFVGASI